MEQTEQQSIEILQGHRDELTEEQYNRILYVIGTQSIEGLHPSAENIDRMVRIVKNEISTDDAISEIIGVPKAV